MQYLTPCRWKYGLRKLGNFCLLNSESCALESGIQLKDCGIPIRLGSGIQVALSCRNLESRIWKPEYTVWNPESKTEKTDATTGFPAKGRLKKKRRNSILMTCHYQDLGSASDWLRQILRAARPIRKHYPDLGTDASSVWNLCARFSDVIW